ncbi:MAG TPA: oligoendopeptidase F [Bacteroidetes bacterium]|nr:oligoendopeptidase F [Bacteroidota bacterium]
MNQVEQSNALTGAENIHWDLSDLYKGSDDPQIKNDMEEVELRVKIFAEKYKGNIAKLTEVAFLELIEEYEYIHDTVGKMGSFVYLQWSTNTASAEYGKLLQSVTEYSSKISQLLVFFDVEWLALDDSAASTFINSPLLSTRKHYLEAARRYKPYILSEKEEQILTAKSVTGSQAWVRYFDETLGAAKFEMDGKEYSEQEVLSKMHDSNREVRIKAAKSLTTGFQGLKRSLTFVFNTLLADKSSSDSLRGYNSWISGRNLSNQISDETVDTLVNSVVDYYPVVQRYYGLKRKLLGLETLNEYDRYAPIMKNESSVSWDDAKKMVLESFGDFNGDMAAIAQRFFDEKWIDAAIRPGKRGGAYSASTVPSVHPYVFMNYDGKIRDVQTLAHELGHGVHQYLSREQGVLQSDTPLTTAETASVFAEMLVFKKILRQLDDPKEKLALLIGKIDDTIATVFRQVSMNRFENAMHTARRNEGELSSDDFSRLWMETQRKLYGDSVELTSDYDIWWCYIPHFLHTPGYVYAYAFGELLVLSLYDRYEKGQDGFAEAYIELLKAGGSDWPENLIGKLGVDINDPSFWNNGLNIIDDLVKQAEALAEQIGATA